MQKTFTDSYIRKLNEACKQNKECDKSCDCIGWCPAVFKKARGHDSAS